MKKVLIAAIILASSISLGAQESRKLEYSPAGSYATAVQMPEQTKGQGLAQAFQLTSNITDNFAGCEITSFNFHVSNHEGRKENRIFDYTIFITEDLNGTPLYTQDITTDQTNCYGKVKALLKTPYKIEKGKNVYIGMQYNLSSKSDLSLVVDGQDHGDDYSGCWIGVLQDDGKYFWDNYTDKISFLCLGVTIEGTTMPVDQVQVESVTSQSAICPGDPLTFQLLFKNTGATTVQSIKTEYTIGDGDPIVEEYRFADYKGIAYNRSGVLTFSGLTYDKPLKEEIVINAKVTSINGVPNVGTPNSGSTTFLCLEKGSGFEKQVVVEEITGTWCQWCPAGIVSMERIREDFPEGGMIPVAVHLNDAMAQESWADIAAMSSGVAPYAFFNRYVSCTPDKYESVLDAYNSVNAIPAVGKVDVSAAFDEATHSVNITATTEFAFDYTDAASRYRLAFGITQDNVGPYKQQNGFSGNPTADCGGWEKLESEVETIFNDVALVLESKEGIRNSIPNVVVSGETYTFSHNIAIDKNVPLEHLNVVAYLINIQNGIIENAATQKSMEQTGINPTIAPSSEYPVEYYNLQGIRINNPSNGIFIRRQGNTVSKIVL